MDAQRPLTVSRPQFSAPGTVMVRPLLLKPQWMNGLSERLLVSHYENNYGGALRRLNAIRARLAALDWARSPVFEINSLKREELIVAGSVILHEIYFESLGGHGDNPPTGFEEPPAGLARALERDFGSVMAWRAEHSRRDCAPNPKLKLDIAGQSENGSDNGIRRDRDEVRHKI